MGIFNRFRKQQEEQQLADVQKQAARKRPQSAQQTDAQKGVKQKSAPKKVAKTKKSSRAKETAQSQRAASKKDKVVAQGSTDSIITPLVTEKSSNLLEEKKALFEVSVHATKNEIAKAAYVLYGVRPLHVRTMIRPAKNVRFGRFSGTRKVTKRAIVTFPKDSNIDVFNN